MAITIDELRKIGLLQSEPEPRLTDKGREWLRVLGDVETQEISDASVSYEELVLSTSGLFR